MLNFTMQTAREAGQILLEKFGKIRTITKKGDINFVSSTLSKLSSKAERVCQSLKK